MDELITWLRATITSDLNKARAANDRSVEWAAQYAGDCALDAEAEHIRANLPRDTIARCEADLAMLDLIERYRVTPEDEASAKLMWHANQLAEASLRRLGHGYRHRRGWQEGWAP